MQWRSHPSLKGKLHPEHPDDLQVVVHDGGPRLTRRQPEVVWVTITSFENGVFTGRILNAPNQLESVRQGQTIRFILDEPSGHAVLATGKYLQERAQWKITACTKCGLSELFDAPSELARATFPSMPPDAEMEGFTAFCPLCGGIQGVERLDTAASPAPRPWWKFWGEK